MARTGRTVALAALAGGASLGLAALGGYGVLVAEARIARRTVGDPVGGPPGADGTYSPDGRYDPAAPESARRLSGPIRLALVGDSSAVGYGVERAAETPGALLAYGLARASSRPVVLHTVAVVGAQSTELGPQIAAALDGPSGPPTIAVVMVGTNDVTHRVRPSVAVEALADAVEELRDAGCEVVVCTCPDLGTIEPVPQPLGWVARKWSRRLAVEQTIVSVRAGAWTVSLGDLLGPEFAARPGELFSADQFHPSAAGYASACAAILPTVLAALGYGPKPDRPEAFRGDGVRRVSAAAYEAANRSGTEVSGDGGHGLLGRGRAVLRHRRRTSIPERPDAAGAAATGSTMPDDTDDTDDTHDTDDTENYEDHDGP